ncbi:MAG: O-methyltransferase, partial [Burkholderiales bacterium]
LVMALSMGKSSSVFALENNEAHLAIAESFWLKAGVHDQIKVFKHNALDSLAQLVNEQYSNSFDIAFIDANKADYLSYYNYCYQLVKPGGIILIDNVLFHGRVLEANPPKYVRAIQEFNHYIYQDKRVEISVLPIADGLTLAYKKKDA